VDVAIEEIVIMQDWTLLKQAQIAQDERLRQANHDHLIVQAMQNLNCATPNRPIYAPALAQIGGWLVAWGSRLQTEYGNIAAKLDESQTSDDQFAHAKM
jgi:hypothetical protein